MSIYTLSFRIFQCIFRVFSCLSVSFCVFSCLSSPCLFVSFRIFSSLSSRCLFVCEVQPSVLILVVRKVSIPILVYFFFQLILNGSSDYYSKLNKTNFVNIYPVFSHFIMYFSFLFESFRIFSCLFVSFVFVSFHV